MSTNTDYYTFKKEAELREKRIAKDFNDYLQRQRFKNQKPKQHLPNDLFEI